MRSVRQKHTKVEDRFFSEKVGFELRVKQRQVMECDSSVYKFKYINNIFKSVPFFTFLLQ